jgi:preprotein translocase subunit SecA
MGLILSFTAYVIVSISTVANSPERRKRTKKDIIYGTNNEFGFDYLRDNMLDPAGICSGTPLLL